MERFIDAQNKCYGTVLKELRNNRKETHWIWFIFPQLIGLGNSWNSLRFSILDKKEAKEYYKHPILGKRLVECCEILLNSKELNIYNIMNKLDATKLQSSMTLFYVSTHKRIFKKVLKKYFEGKLDTKTLAILKGQK